MAQIEFVGPAYRVVDQEKEDDYAFLCASHGVIIANTTSKAPKQYVRDKVKRHYDRFHGNEPLPRAFLEQRRPSRKQRQGEQATDNKTGGSKPRKRSRKLDASLPLYDLTRRKSFNLDFWKRWGLDLGFGSKTPVVERCRELEPKVHSLLRTLGKFRDQDARRKDADAVKTVVRGYDAAAACLQHWNVSEVHGAIERLKELQQLQYKLDSVKQRAQVKKETLETRDVTQQQQDVIAREARKQRIKELKQRHKTELKQNFYESEHVAIVEEEDGSSYLLLLASAMHISEPRKKQIVKHLAKYLKSDAFDVEYWKNTFGVNFKHCDRVVLPFLVQLQPKLATLVEMLSRFADAIGRVAQEKTALRDVYQAAYAIGTNSEFVRAYAGVEGVPEPTNTLPATTATTAASVASLAPSPVSRTRTARDKKTTSSHRSSTTTLFASSSSSSSASNSAVKLFQTSPDGGTLTHMLMHPVGSRGGNKRRGKGGGAISTASNNNKRRKIASSSSSSSFQRVPSSSSSSSSLVARAANMEEAREIAQEAAQRLDELQQFAELLKRMRNVDMSLD